MHQSYKGYENYSMLHDCAKRDVCIANLQVQVLECMTHVCVLCLPVPQYPMDKNKGLKVPVQIRVNMWLGLASEEKKFNSFSEGTFSVFAEMVCFPVPSLSLSLLLSLL